MTPAAESPNALGAQGAPPPKQEGGIPSILTRTEISEPISVNPSPASGETQQNPAIAEGQDIYLVVWEVGSYQNTPPYIAGVRVRASDGALLDSSPFPIATSPYAQTQPAVAFDGTHFLVVWTENRGTPAIYGRRIQASDGGRVDADSFLISRPTIGGAEQGGQTFASVAFDGTNYLVVWQNAWSFGTWNYSIEATFVRASDGALIESWPRILTVAGWVVPPQEASAQGSFLVTWVDRQSLQAIRVTSSSLGLSAPFFVTASADQVRHSVVGQGDEFLVVWRDSGSVLARRVRASDGTLLGSASTTVGTSALFVSSVAHDGVDYRVLFHSSQSGNMAVVSTRLSALAEVVPGSELEVSRGWPFPEVIASTAPGRYLVAYIDADASGGPRVKLRRVTEG